MKLYPPCTHCIQFFCVVMGGGKWYNKFCLRKRGLKTLLLFFASSGELQTRCHRHGVAAQVRFCCHRFITVDHYWHENNLKYCSMMRNLSWKYNVCMIGYFIYDSWPVGVVVHEILTLKNGLAESQYETIVEMGNFYKILAFARTATR